MFSIHLKRYEKFRNSIARPDLSQDVDIKVGEIKGDFSPLAFEVTFELGVVYEMPKWNYAYIMAWDKYYFIDNWTFQGGLWTASFVEDVLATFAPEIYNSHQYILRCASRSHDNSSKYIDTTYMQGGASTRSYQQIDASNFWGNTADDGCVVCGIVGSSGSNIGAVTYYAMTMDTFNNFIFHMLDMISWANIDPDEISEDLQKALINPVQYIVSSHWLPIPYTDISGSTVTNVNLGWWSFSLSGSRTAKRLYNPKYVITKELTMQLPRHPQYNDDGCSFVRFSPFTRYTLKFLPFGVFELDTAALGGIGNLIDLTVRINPMTGDATLDVSCGDDNNKLHSLITTQANVAVQLPTGQVSANLGNFDNALMVGAIAGANDVVSALGDYRQTRGGTTVNANGFSNYSGTF